MSLLLIAGCVVGYGVVSLLLGIFIGKVAHLNERRF